MGRPVKPGLIAQPAPEGAPPATMSMADALDIAIRQAEAADPINYAYIHALRAVSVRVDHTRTDDLARALETLLTAEPGTGAADAARRVLSEYRGVR